MDPTILPLVLAAPPASDVLTVTAPARMWIHGAAPGAKKPCVVIAFGFADDAIAKLIGRPYAEPMRSQVDWATLLVAAGAVVVLSVPHDPVTDLQHVLAHVRANAGSLGVDLDRLVLWASSGSGPVALDALSRGGFSRAAVLYAYMLGPQVEAVAPRIGFANPAAGKSVSDLPAVPLMVVRCGQDKTPLLNDTIDAFAAAAIAANLPLTLVNLPDAPHSFDLFHDADTSRALIRQVVAFLTS